MIVCGALDLPAWILFGVFLLAGTLSLLASLLNWDWFFNTSSARALGGGPASRLRARWIYGLTGTAIIFAAFMLVMPPR